MHRPVPFSIALFHNLIFIDTGDECKSGFFEVNLSGGVYEVHGEDFSFDPLCLPVHSAGRMSFGAFLVHFFEPKTRKTPSECTQKGFLAKNKAERARFRRPGAVAISVPSRGVLAKLYLTAVGPDGPLVCFRHTSATSELVSAV